MALRADVAARAAARRAGSALADAAPGGLAWGDGPEDRLAVRGDVGATAWISCAASMPWGGSPTRGPTRRRRSRTRGRRSRRSCRHAATRGSGFASRATGRSPTCRRRCATCSPTAPSSLVVRGHGEPRAPRTPPATAGRADRRRPRPRGDRLDVRAGASRSRLDLAGADWPNAWPPPGVGDAGGRPVGRRAGAARARRVPRRSPTAPSFPPSTRPQVDPREDTDEGWSEWRVTDDVVARGGWPTARYGGGATPEDGTPGTSNRVRRAPCSSPTTTRRTPARTPSPS